MHCQLAGDCQFFHHDGGTGCYLGTYKRFTDGGLLASPNTGTVWDGINVFSKWTESILLPP